MQTGILYAGLAALFATSGWLSVIDLREHRLPNRIVGPLAAGVTLWVLGLGLIDGDLGRALGAFGWGGIAVAGFFGLNLIAGLGMGDVKYAWPVFVTLGWFGADFVRLGVSVMVLVGGVAGLVTQLQRKGLRHRLAFGPCMAAGLAVGVVAALI